MWKYSVAKLMSDVEMNSKLQVPCSFKRHFPFQKGLNDISTREGNSSDDKAGGLMDGKSILKEALVDTPRDTLQTIV